MDISIEKFIKKEVDVTIENPNESISIFKIENSQDFYTFELVKELRGGKSGDSVLLVRNSGNMYVLKIFTPGDNQKTIKDNNEIKYHADFMNLFEEFVPCPKIFMFGYVNRTPFSDNRSPKRSKYVVMEALTPPFELDNLISNKCIESEKNSYADSIDSINIIIQLFYILSKMKLNDLFHCDMHPQNIMIVNNPNKIQLNFDHIESNYSFTLGDHLVKIIDFGEGGKTHTEHGKLTDCRLQRTTSGALEDLKERCDQSKDIAKLVYERTVGAKGDSDINFFINILILMSSFTKKLSNLDFTQLEEYSKKIGSKIIPLEEKSFPGFKKTQTRTLLFKFLSELMKIIPKAGGSTSKGKKRNYKKKQKQSHKRNRSRNKNSKKNKN